MTLLAALAAALTTGCGGGGSSSGGSSTTSTAHYTIGGSVSGLSGTGLVLQDNGGDNMSVASGTTTFTLPTALASGSTYAVTVLTQPTNPVQNCTVSSGTGTASGADVTNVAVNCVTEYTVGGSVSGLTGTGLVLQNNGGDNATVAANATSFTFPTRVPSGTHYAVSVLTQPTNPAQLCAVANGSGTVGTSSVTTAAVSCRTVGKYVFAANYTNPASGSNGDISVFTINPTTGALTEVANSPFDAGPVQNPVGIVVDPNGQNVYVLNQGADDVATLALNAGSGVLKWQGNAGAEGISAVSSIAIAPSGQYLFAGGTTAFVDAFSLSAGQLSFLNTADDAEGTPPHGLAVDPASQLVFATDAYQTRITVFGIGAGNSGLNYLEKDRTGNNPYSVVVDPTAHYVYVTNKTDGDVSAYSYDPAAAAGSVLTPLPDSPYDAGTGPTGIAIDPTGHLLYVTNSGDNTVSAFTIDPSTGALTSVGAAVATGNLTGNPSQPMDVKVDPSSQFAYVANYGDDSVSVFTISAATGALTLTGTVPAGAAIALGIE